MAESQMSPPSTPAGAPVQPQQPQAETPKMQEPHAQTQAQQTHPAPSSLGATVQLAEQPHQQHLHLQSQSQTQSQSQSESQSQPQPQPQPQPSTSEPLAETDTPTAAGEMAGADNKDDVVMGGTEGDAAQAGAPGTSNAAPVPGAGMNALEMGASGTTSKKDTSLREFMGQMDDYAPIIPDAVTAHYLTSSGLPPPGNDPDQTPPHLARLLALATQKFVADIAADAYQYARIRNSNSSSNTMGAMNLAAGLNVGGTAAGGGGGSAGDAAKGKAAGLHLGVQRPGFGGGGQGGSQGKTVLTMEDLGMAVAEYGVSVKRGEFYR